MYKKVMVPLDGSDLAECVLPHVKDFIKSSLAKTVVFVMVVEPLPLLLYGESVEAFPVSTYGESYAARLEHWQTVEAERKSAAEEYLKKASSFLNEYGERVQCEVLIGKVAQTLAAYAEDKNVDLTMIATHGRSGVSRWIMGSVADRVFRSSNAPVLMVRTPGSKAMAQE
ncbi:MAG TPA: universal stress protein [Syntrophales bacterium]|nr:universal stress protein [Syntrophales bacterium]